MTEDNVPGSDKGKTNASAVDWPNAWHLAIFYLVCLFGAGYAQLLAIVPGTGISIWLPSGLVLGALLANPRRTWLIWIGIASAAELTGNVLWFHNDLPVALLIIIANGLESLVGALLISQLVGWPFRLERLRDVLGLTLLGTIIAPIVTSLFGGLTLEWAAGRLFTDASFGDAFWQSFWLLWIGDSTGVLIAAPAVVTIVAAWGRRERADASRWPEAAALIVGSVLVAAASLSGQLPFGLIIIPIVLLAAVRFHFWGGVVSAAALTLLAAAFQVSAVNPFVLVGSELESHVQLQLFLAITSFSALVVASLAKQNELALQRVLEANRDLEQRVLERTARLTASEARLKQVLETAQVGVAFGNERAMLTQANDALGKLLGRSPMELGGGTVSWRSMLVEGEKQKFNHEQSRLTSEGRSGPIELIFARPDGTTVPAIFAATRLDYGEHVAFVIDQREQKQHEEQIGLLMRELNHRAKNTLMLVLSIARQTKAATMPEFLDRFSERVQALAASQNLLVDNKWKGAPLESIVREQLSHLRDSIGTRIAINGAPVVLTPSAAQTIGLAIHELATNSGKYGALSNETGRIAIRWEHRPNNRLGLSWSETGGPAVNAPDHEGFGTTVVGAMVRSNLGGEVDISYEPSGLRWSIECPLESLTTTIADGRPN